MKLHKQVREALTNGAGTIERLRRENELLRIKAQAFDTLSSLVQLISPKQGGGYEPDAVYIMRQLVDRLEEEEHQHFLKQNDIQED